ncbi:hypothetical protein EDC01DRAFT_617646 [Geopyxis carbonaria]|nr:hypothetical protein EDC01DRAFT_617646 [Geopyxis carbonaria]
MSAEPETETAAAAVVDDTSPVYFWKPTGPFGHMSQWYPSRFTCPSTGHTYAHTEQYMMHRKGLLFAPDSPITLKILTTTDPRICKALGRKVPDFDPAVWERERLAIVTDGNWLKYSQDKELRGKLLETGGREIVEASPRDRVWGIGFGAVRAGSVRERWGRNLLGVALEEVRGRLREEKEEEEEEDRDEEDDGDDGEDDMEEEEEET